MKDIDDTAGTAAYLNAPERTLEDWRYRGDGPPFVRMGRRIRYRRADVDAWLVKNTVRSS